MAFYNGPEPISSRHMVYFNCVRRLSSQKKHNENYNIGPLDPTELKSWTIGSSCDWGR
jgi:hypothetical protein